jgi:hypothetical protein
MWKGVKAEPILVGSMARASLDLFLRTHPPKCCEFYSMRRWIMSKFSVRTIIIYHCENPFKVELYGTLPRNVAKNKII